VVLDNVVGSLLLQLFSGKLTSGHSDEVPPPHLEKTLSTHISLKTQPFLFRSSKSYSLY
jgi:hypothetical protein